MSLFVLGKSVLRSILVKERPLYSSVIATKSVVYGYASPATLRLNILVFVVVPNFYKQIGWRIVCEQ